MTATSCLRRSVAVAGMLCALMAPVAAHEVQHEIAQAKAMVVGLVYADGEPFSYESYELFADGSDRPSQTGRTDARGRVVFLSDETKTWRLRAFSADGHGVDLKFDAVAGGAQATVAAESGRYSRLLLGLSFILALFGALQLFLRKKKTL
ncbi:MAG: nickel transport protein [Burkholderiales bacterium]